MSKTIKIILYIAILLIGYFSITAVYKSCNSEKVDNFIEQQDDSTTSDEEDDFFNDFEDSEDISTTKDNDDEAINSKDSSTENESDDSEEIDYQTLDNKLKNSDDDSREDSYQEPKKTITKPTYTNNTSGKYLIVSGSFLVQQNAANLVAKLKRMGYNNAEVVVFDGSSYYTVVAERTNSRTSARNTVSSLKNKGVDSYMHTKQ